MKDLNTPVHVTVVLGLHNGVIYHRFGEGQPFISQLGTEHDWIAGALRSRPDDWQILHEGIVYVSDFA